MNQNATPRFDEQRFTYFREENAGYASAISPEDPSKALHVLNPTVVDVARLCDGARTVSQIRAAYGARYQQPPDGPLASYVDEALFILSLYNLLEFGPSAAEPRSAGEPIPTVRRLDEGDLTGIVDLLSGGSFPEKADVPLFHFRHPYVQPEHYTELLLRLRIFQQREIFYAVVTGPRVDFFVSLFDERPLKPMATIATIAGSPRYSLEEGISYVMPEVLRESRELLHKLEWRYVTGEHDFGPVAKLLVRHGFRKEAVLAGEFGPDRDEVVYSLILPHETVPPGAAPPGETPASVRAKGGRKPKRSAGPGTRRPRARRRISS